MLTERCACGRLLTLKEEWKGKLIRCPACRAVRRAGETRATTPPAAQPELDSPDLEISFDDSRPSGGPNPAVSGAHKTAATPPPPTQPSIARPPVADGLGAPGVKRKKKKGVAPARDVDFRSEMFKAFFYPAIGSGLWGWSIGALLLIISHFVVRYAGKIAIIGELITVAFGLYVAGMLIGYVLKIISTSAKGDLRPPDLPEIRGPTAVAETLKLVLPFVFVVVMGMVSYRFLPDKAKAIMNSAFFKVGVLAIASLCVPMSLLSVALVDDMVGLSPVRIIRAIFTVPLHYAIIAMATFAAGIAYYFGKPYLVIVKIPMLIIIVAAVAEIYGIMLIGRMIGIMYAASPDRLRFLKD